MFISKLFNASPANHFAHHFLNIDYIYRLLPLVCVLTYRNIINYEITFISDLIMLGS
jgi:hypothetical protein